MERTKKGPLVRGVKALVSPFQREVVPRHLFIAKNEKGQILSIIAASNKTDAELFWQGAKIFAIAVEELDLNAPDLPRVVSIATTDMVQIFENGRAKTLCVVHRGA